MENDNSPLLFSAALQAVAGLSADIDQDEIMFHELFTSGTDHNVHDNALPHLLFKNKSSDQDRSFAEYIFDADDAVFFSHFRMKNEDFVELELILLQNASIVKYDTTSDAGRPEVPFRSALLMTLWYLSSKTTFREISNLFGYPMSSVNRVFYKVLDVIQLCEPLDVTWPIDLNAVRNKFLKISKFPGVIGSVDGTHIRIKPPAAVQRDYNSRKLVHTMLLLGVCDADMVFTNISTGFPGSMHDQRAFSHSTIGRELEVFPNTFISDGNYHLVGDSAFKLTTCVMTPYRDDGNLDDRKIRFNTKLSQARQVVERAFGMLKTRFRCLKHLEVDIEHSVPIIDTCVRLHNFIMKKIASGDANENPIFHVENGIPLQKRESIANYLT